MPIKYQIYIYMLIFYEKFEDTKGTNQRPQIDGQTTLRQTKKKWSRKLKIGQHEPHDLQNTCKQKTKDWPTRTP